MDRPETANPLNGNLPLLAILLFVMIGVTPFATIACREVWTWDTDRQEWVPVDPIAIQPAIDEAADIAKATLAATGQPLWIPLVDIVAKAIALIFAFRFVQPRRVQPQDTPKE